MPNKHALLIGINEYQFMEDEYQLSGCVNDAKLMRQVLVRKFGFQRENIRTLFNKEATREGMLAQMHEMVSVLDKDDIFVFHYSGHGHQCRVKTEFTDEGSGKLNCILPTDDSEPKPDSDEVHYREIREHEINEWLQKVAEKTKYTTLIFDACHSATITRGAREHDPDIDGPKDYAVRFVPESVRNQVVTLDTDTATRALAENTNADNSTGWLNLSENYVVISGCRDTQQSKEQYFYEGNTPFKHGVMTYSLCAALQEAQPGTTYRDVFEQVSAKVITLAQQQNPQIEGAIDREVLGVTDIEPLNFIAIESVNGDSVVMAGGAAQNVSVNSVWNVYEPYTKNIDEKAFLGKINVLSVDGLTSTAQITKQIKPIPSGARAILVEEGEGAKKLKVDISGLPEPTKKSLETLISSSKLLEIATSIRQADLIGFHAEDQFSLPPEFAVGLSKTASNPLIGFTTGQHELSMPIHGINNPGIESLLLDNLEKIAKYRNIIQLKNPNSSLDVEFNLFRRLPDNSVELANGGTTDFSGKAPIVLEFKNNSPDKTVYFNALWMTASCKVMHIYPPRKSSEELGPNCTVRIGEQHNSIAAELSEDYFANIGMESIKVFFSTEETDFRFLNQSGLRMVDDKTAVIPEFESASTGEEAEESENSVNDWQAINRSFILSRLMN